MARGSESGAARRLHGKEGVFHGEEGVFRGSTRPPGGPLATDWNLVEDVLALSLLS